jgi:hypothetical protein
MKNGTRYVLRFGNLTNVTGGQTKTKRRRQDAAGIPRIRRLRRATRMTHRYSFVMAEFDENWTGSLNW